MTDKGHKLTKLKTVSDTPTIRRNVLFPPEILDEIQGWLKRGELSGFMWRAGLLLLAADTGNPALKAWATGVLVAACEREKDKVHGLAVELSDIASTLSVIADKGIVETATSSRCSGCSFYQFDDSLGCLQCLAGPDDRCLVLESVLGAIKEGDWLTS